MSYGCSKTGDASGFRGCGRSFGDLAAGFDAHFVKVTAGDDPRRDPAVVSIMGDRCATDAELGALGLVLRLDGSWAVPLTTQEKAALLARLRKRTR